MVSKNWFREIEHNNMVRAAHDIHMCQYNRPLKNEWHCGWNYFKTFVRFLCSLTLLLGFNCDMPLSYSMETRQLRKTAIDRVAVIPVLFTLLLIWRSISEFKPLQWILVLKVFRIRLNVDSVEIVKGADMIGKIAKIGEKASGEKWGKNREWLHFVRNGYISLFSIAIINHMQLNHRFGQNLY